MQHTDINSPIAPIRDMHVEIPLEKVTLEGRLTIPRDAHGIVIFAHGSGSSRFSSRNWFVAEILHEHNIATLLTDLLTALTCKRAICALIFLCSQTDWWKLLVGRKMSLRLKI